jgi:tetratricopeptide (TPR) repeat protein
LSEIAETLEGLMAQVERGELEPAQVRAEAALRGAEAVDHQIAILTILAQIKQVRGDVEGARADALRASALADANEQPEAAKALRRLASSVEVANPEAALLFEPLAERMMAALAGGDARAALAVAETLLVTADAVGPVAIIAVAIGGASAALALAARAPAASFLARGEAVAESGSDRRSLLGLRRIHDGPDPVLATFAGNYALEHEHLDDAVAIIAPALRGASPEHALPLHRMMAVAHYRAQRVADALQHTAVAYRLARSLNDGEAAASLANQVAALRDRLSSHVPSQPKVPAPASTTAAGVHAVLTVLRTGDLLGAHALSQQALAETGEDDPTRIPLLALRARLQKLAGDIAGAQASLAEALALAKRAGGGPVMVALSAQFAALPELPEASDQASETTASSAANTSSSGSS